MVAGQALGCSFASKQLGPKGLCVGVDLEQADDFDKENIHIIQGDINDEATQKAILAINPNRFDNIISDMSPKLTGIKAADQAAISHLGQLAFNLCQTYLVENGNLVIKLFKGQDCDDLVRQIRTSFKKSYREELKSTRKSSNEYYFIGTGFKLNT